MGGTDRCAVPCCGNYRKFPDKLVVMKHVSTLMFHGPRPNELNDWEKAIGSKEIKVTSRTKVCSNHFKYGKPYPKDRLPSLYLKGYPTQERPSARRVMTRIDNSKESLPLRQSKKRKVMLDHCYEGTENIVFPKCNDSTPESSQESNTCAYTVNDLQNEHMYSANENVVLKCETSSDLKSVLDNLSHQMETLKQERDFYYCELEKAKGCLENVEKSLDEMKHNFTFGVHTLVKDDSLVKLYTGLPSMAVFNYVFEKISPQLERLEYYKGEKSLNAEKHRHESSNIKPGPQRVLSYEDEMLMTLMKLRLNLTEDDLAVRFAVSRSLVSSILTTWINFLALELEGLINWPDLSEILDHYPNCFKKFGNVVAVIDCFEIPLQRASMSKANAQTFSSYKDRTTAKILVACTPSGAVSLISTSFGGSISDKEIVMQSELLQKLEESALKSDVRTTVLADKGFNIQELLVPIGVRLHIPPFLKNKQQLSEVDNKSTKSIANARIHVERVIGRLKEFQILKSELSVQFADLLDNMLIICAALVNLQPRLVKS